MKKEKEPEKNTDIRNSKAGVIGDDAKVEGDIHFDNSATHFSGTQIVYVEKGATYVSKDDPVHMTAVDRESALGRYLNHVISQNRFLQLQGIRAGGRLVHIELDRIYITLQTTRNRKISEEEEWLRTRCEMAPGEGARLGGEDVSCRESVIVSVNQALAEDTRFVVLGDPGSGKTTLLRYMALLYARDIAEGTAGVSEKLVLDEVGRLPILIPFRNVGAFLSQTPDDGLDGHGRLLDFLYAYLRNQRIDLPPDFFDDHLAAGKAVILLDGLDEVANPDLRRRVSRLAEAFTAAHPKCRYVVTSRIVGYVGAARLGENYRVTTVQDFSLADVETFLSNWHRLIAIGQMGPGGTAKSHAEEQTRHLMDAITGNERIRELAINPLMLTVIALVHRDRVKLPDRRAELYAEAVDVLLGKWDEAKGARELPVLDDRPFDAGDKRLMLQNIALAMHEKGWKEIPVADLRDRLKTAFGDILTDPREADRATNRFLEVIEARTGLMSARGEGVYSFSHLTFQEYLAALAVAGRDDYVRYTIARSQDRWWREVILLEAGYLSTQSRERTTRLIRAIADRKEEPEPYHNLVLAAECLRDVGKNRVDGDLSRHVPGRLKKGIETPPSIFSKMLKRFGPKGWIEQRGKAMEALVRAGEGYWSMPYGEPEWVEIPEGEFQMGEGNNMHTVHLERYFIALVPVTNAQYRLFVKETEYDGPEHWADGRPPKGKEGHPAVYISWHDAMAYCQWLSSVTGKDITLPSEAEWEKAARGTDSRIYPWGNKFDAHRCNAGELGLNDTTPVGIFPEGASPYGVLDMSGNVWEWTRSIWGDDWEKPDFGYPYDPNDGREDESSGADRVIRGGSWGDVAECCRSAYRLLLAPGYRIHALGFRLALRPGQVQIR